MKKNLIIGAVVLVLLILVGGLVFLKGGKKTAEAPKGEVKTEKTAESKDDGNLILDTAEKIKNAIAGGKKMECTFKEDLGDGKQTEMKMQSQGEKFRSSYAVKDETFVSVSDGETIYSWSSKTKEGTKMDLKCMDDLSKDVPQVKDDAVDDKIDFTEPETLVDEQPDMKCSPILSIDLSVPSDVKFTDTCAEMKKVFESMKDLNVNLPQGINIPQSE